MNIKEKRRQIGISQSELAAKAGVTRVTIARIEDGTRRASPELAKRLKYVLNLSAAETWDLFYGDQPPKAAEE